MLQYTSREGFPADGGVCYKMKTGGDEDVEK